MITAKIDEAQLARVERKLNRFGKQMADRTPANRQVSIQLYAWCLNNFRGEGSNVGGWPPLAESTIAEKRRIRKERMMIRTGQLRNSFNQFYDKDNAGIGNDVTYSIYHHSEKPRTKLPRRQLLPDRDVVLDIGMRVYQNYVARSVMQANR
jgi:phage gpG-like protein